MSEKIQAACFINPDRKYLVLLASGGISQKTGSDIPVDEHGYAIAEDFEICTDLQEGEGFNAAVLRYFGSPLV